jgi:hypothetical protein
MHTVKILFSILKNEFPTKSCVPKLVKNWWIQFMTKRDNPSGMYCLMKEFKHSHMVKPLLRCQAEETDVLLGTAFTGTRLIKCHPCTTMVVQQLKQLDYAAKICFYNWLLKNVHEGFTDPQLLFVYD